MCGIAGILGAMAGDERAVEAVLASRGPDGRGTDTEPGVWLLHRRLAVIDPTPRSDQPFSLGSDVTGLFNGELLNYRDLAGNDDTLLHSTEGDTEVFLRLLARGARDVNRARGMYAGAVINKRSLSVLTARDPFGVKPLYWEEAGGQFAFASQVRCFPGLTGPRRLAGSALATYLRFGCVFADTMYEGVVEHEPGVVAEWRAGTRHVSPLSLPSGEYAGLNDIRRLLDRAVHRNLTADVPVCLLLSGGVDSAVLAAIGREAFEAAVTLSVGGEYDEAARAAETARRYGIPHRVFAITADDAREAVVDFFRNQDQPSIDGLNTYLLARHVAQAGFKVAVAGVGSDELFGGYDSFRRLLYARLSRWVPARLLKWAPIPGTNPAKRAAAIASRHDAKELYLISREVFTTGEVQQLAGLRVPDPWASRHASNLLDRTGDVTLSGELGLYMRHMLLRDIDAQSMASSVEVRVPFLDEDLAAAAMRRSGVARALEGKRCLARALDDPYVRGLTRRRKTGFRLPMHEWMDGPLMALLDKALAPGSPLSKVVDVRVARSLLDANGHWARRWTLVVLNEWLERNATAGLESTGFR